MPGLELDAAPSTATTIARRALVVAGVLGLADLAIGAARGHALFLRPVEWMRFAALSLALSFVLGAFALGVARSAERLAQRLAGPRAERALRVAAGLAGVATATPILVALTDGRRVRDHVLRYPAVAVGAVVVGIAVAWVVRRARSAPETAARAGTVAVLFAAASVAAQAADAFVLPRLYPSFHAGLALSAFVFALAAAAVVVRPRAELRRRRIVASWALLVGAIPLLAGALGLAASAPNTSFAIRAASPLAGKALALAARDVEVASGGEGVARAPAAAEPRGRGIALGDADVLLLTVDALRADRLEAYGGRGLTPEMDALAREGMVFERAYTPTPHTSYAVSSLLTGKYLRPVLELARAPTDHPTLPDLLRRYGFRTAAFYPPAIFYVDAERFRMLEERAYGFEYRKEMFAPAADRVAQVDEYLDGVGAGTPVFVWVHFFEPHEPYEPPPEHARGDSAAARYDGEVATVDAAIGELVRRFRARRPGATVILTADHGEELGDHGGQFHGSTVYDEQVRVPLVWSSPGVVAAGRTRAPVELVDVATTILGALGIPRDARMRGDDLGPILAGGEGGPTIAYAAVDHERMITDGTLKAICELRAPACRLYDLVADPAERTNVAEARPRDESRLRAELAALVGSIPRVEALAMEGATGWPDALARAALGDVTALPDVEPLLGDPRAEVRAEAARLVGALGAEGQLPLLVRLAGADPDGSVRAEAALARLALGDRGAVGDVLPLLDEATEADRARRRRAALALARAAESAGGAILAEWAADVGAGEGERLAAIEALAELRHREAVPALVGLLDEVRLRPAIARALARIGDPRAATPLAEALAEERHLAARAAEAEALVALGDARAARLVRRFLGTEQPLPGGIALLATLRALAPHGRLVGATADGTTAGLTCDDGGCVVGAEASLGLPAVPPARAHRLVLSVEASPGATLRVGGATIALAGGPQDVSVALPSPRDRVVAVAANGRVRVLAMAIVPATDEVPAPPPEPWEPEPEG